MLWWEDWKNMKMGVKNKRINLHSMKKTTSKKISKTQNIAQIAQQNPEAVQKLVGDYGLHCLGCPMAAFESLEEGAQAHGMSADEIDSMVEELNKKK